MQGDSESRLPGRDDPDLWRLPPLSLVEAVRVLYARPRRHMVKGELVEHAAGVEILVRTEEPIPVRALSPALFIGNEQVVENEAMGSNDYRFFVPDAGRLEAGAPVRLGWVGQPPPADKKSRTPFRYAPPTREVTELSLSVRRGG